MEVFALKSNEHYGWFTGTTRDGRQVLAADNVHLFFDSEGVFLELEEFEDISSWKERAAAVIALPDTIHVQEFSVSDRSISVRQRPSDSSNEIRDWDQNDLFEFCLGDDFWMNSDGSVHSH